MKTGEAAHLLGIDPKTVVNWINNEQLSKFFSPGARKESGLKQRLLTDEDVVLLNTIRHESANGKPDWAEIALVIERGDLQRDIPQNAAYLDTRMVPEPQARESALAAATMAERNQLQTIADDLRMQITKLEQRLDDEQAGRRHDNERLAREIGDARAEKEKALGDLNAKLVEAETLLKLYRKRGRIEGDDET